ncbi:peptidase C15, pyroglutamyl peptidase I-like protein [Ramicandelaber brevisporus]|nr:peptidase C15, pyroglutamyl peptidase I-like protein [Ramicandelaber brevisporus]
MSDRRQEKQEQTQLKQTQLKQTQQQAQTQQPQPAARNHRRQERAFITGFEPFGNPRPATNISWQTVADLDGAVISTAAADVELVVREIPVEYAPVSTLVPQVHRLGTAAPIVARRDKTGSLPADTQPGELFTYYIHVGAGKHEPCVYIETVAHRDGYDKPGNDGPADLPPEGRAHYRHAIDIPPVHDDDEHGDDDNKDSTDEDGDAADPHPCCYAAARHTTTVDVAALVKHLREKRGWTHTAPSTDAGRYLCEYTFYTSMGETARKARNGAKEAGLDRASAIAEHALRERALFVHLPPDGMIYSAAQMRQIVHDIVEWLAAVQNA